MVGLLGSTLLLIGVGQSILVGVVGGLVLLFHLRDQLFYSLNLGLIVSSSTPAAEVGVPWSFAQSWLRTMPS